MGVISTLNWLEGQELGQCTSRENVSLFINKAMRRIKSFNTLSAHTTNILQTFNSFLLNSFRRTVQTSALPWKHLQFLNGHHQILIQTNRHIDESSCESVPDTESSYQAFGWVAKPGWTLWTKTIADWFLLKFIYLFLLFLHEPWLADGFHTLPSFPFPASPTLPAAWLKGTDVDPRRIHRGRQL